MIKYERYGTTMKRVYLITGLVIMLIMAGCSQRANETPSALTQIDTVGVTTAPTTTTDEATPTTAPTETTDPTTAPTATPTPTPTTVATSDGRCYVTFNGDSMTIDGSGCKEKDGNLLIKEAGTYVITGTLNDGMIKVNVDEGDAVYIILNGVTITHSDCAAIYIKDAPLTVITLAAGTVNTLTDASVYVYEDETEEEPSAALFSKDDLTIRGTGKLIINANFNDGITCKDVLRIENGTYVITSVDDAIIGRDALNISGGTFTLTSGGDAVKATNDEDTSLGTISISGGTFTINASAKGVKAVNTITLSGGQFNIKSSDDAIHSNTDIAISDGTFTISTGDDGVHADSSLTVNGGTITITKSYEGIESSVMTINGGTISIVATDDGVNVAGGNDTNTGGWGFDYFNSSSSHYLYMNGGKIYVSAAGDGVDVNGSVVMTGGEIYVDGPTNDGNGALDYDGTFVISGGTLIAAGSSGMLQAPSTSSTQYSISAIFSASQTAGKTVKLVDSDGNVVATYTPSKTFKSIVISTAAIKKGATYSLYVDTTLISTFTVSSTVTSINSGSSGGTTRPGRR